MDFEIEFPDLNPERWMPWRLLRAMCPRPDLQLLLLLPTEEAKRRCDLKQEPFPPSPEVRRLREQAYQELATRADWVPLDANRSAEEVHLAIMETLEETVGPTTNKKQAQGTP